jgi:hypothetical protein
MTVSGIGDIGREFVLLDAVEPVMLRSRKKACRARYPGHPDGCPKHGKCPDCPPDAPWFGKLYRGPVRVAAVVFNFAGFIAWRRSLRPDWTEKALRNPRHWQGHLAAALNRHLADVKLDDDEEIVFNPEAQGIDVTATCAAVGLELEWPPRGKVCRVAMIARKR